MFLRYLNDCFENFIGHLSQLCNIIGLDIWVRFWELLFASVGMNKTSISIPSKKKKNYFNLDYEIVSLIDRDVALYSVWSSNLKFSIYYWIYSHLTTWQKKINTLIYYILSTLLKYLDLLTHSRLVWWYWSRPENVFFLEVSGSILFLC